MATEQRLTLRPDNTATEFLDHGGEMGARMRAFDWARTPLGPAEQWPQSLKTAVRILLTSRFAMWMAWGPELTFFCNDAYLPTVGIKRDWVLGARSDAVWSEIWPDIGPRIEHVLRSGTATWDEALLLYLERSGFSEETYHTFSYSPLADDSGATVGMLCVVTEVTERVIGERQLGSLRDLGSRLAGAATRQDLMAGLEAALAAESRDLPFAVAYLCDEARGVACRAALHGLDPASPGAAAELRLDAATPSPWPLAAVLANATASLVEVPADIGATVPLACWQRPPHQALVMPIADVQGGAPIGFIVAGLNPHRVVDADYRGFLELITGQVAAAIARADAYERARARADALAELDRAKTAFFSNVSHEFRTPLTLMLGPLEEVLAKPDSEVLPPNRALVEVAHRNGLRLLRLVNALLDFSRIEAGRAQARYQPTDLAGMTADLASTFRSICERAGLTLEIDCPPLAAPVYVDHEMWEKILLNLVSNAFKFTLAGHIAIRLREADGAARLEVEDSGVGVPEAELPRLFERFHRVEGSQGRSFEGSGIGLALVHDLVGLHGGTITAASRLGQGTVFTVTIPLGRAHLPAAQVIERTDAADPPIRAAAFAEEASRWLAPDLSPDLLAPDLPPGDVLRDAGPKEDGAGGERSRVLVADDNADLRDYVSRLLRGEGYAVRVVPDGAAALAALREERPELLVTDVMMPRLDGFGLLRAVREDATLRDLPVLMLSARSGEESALEGLDAGADDYLTKPFSARELLARVAAALSTARLRKEVTAALAESERRFRNMAEHAPVMLWVTDPTGRCTYANRAWYAFTGHVVHEADSVDWLGAVHPDDRDATNHAYRAALAEQRAFHSEYRLRRQDGAYRWVIDTASARVDDAGRFLGHIGSVLDITERKDAEAELEARVREAIAERAKVEEALRQAQKMEAVGQLTGGIAHDFNNLLQGVAGSLDLIRRRPENRERVLRLAEAGLKAAERGARLTGQLLAFSRAQKMELKPVALASLVAAFREMLGRTIGPSVAIVLDLKIDGHHVLGDEVQLEMAILNLALNARDAMPNGGTLTISAQPRPIARHPNLPDGDYVELSVTDDGTGMEPEVAARAFDPFFTTKGVGAGTGLGLSQVYGTVRQAGGEVTIETTPGRGTTVRMLLRCTDPPVATAPAPDGADARPASAAVVLVVDDDPDVRRFLADSVESLGYVAMEAEDAQSGLTADERASPDALIIDFAMPGMNGAELARRVRARRPDVPIIFATGFAQSAEIEAALGPEARILRKPFRVDDLHGALVGALDGHAAAD